MLDIDTESKATGLKVVLVGDTNVGKTSILSRLIDDTFDPGELPTIGAGVRTKRIMAIVGSRREEIVLSCWDTAGQSAFRRVMPLYCQGARCVVIVTSVDEPESMTGVPEWVEMIKESCDNGIPMFLAINKIDIAGSDWSEKRAELERDYTSEFRSIFFISAKTGESVEELFIAAALAASQFFLFITGNQRSHSQSLVWGQREGCSC